VEARRIPTPDIYSSYDDSSCAAMMAVWRTSDVEACNFTRATHVILLAPALTCGARLCDFVLPAADEPHQPLSKSRDLLISPPFANNKLAMRQFEVPAPRNRSRRTIMPVRWTRSSCGIGVTLRQRQWSLDRTSALLSVRTGGPSGSP